MATASVSGFTSEINSLYTGVCPPNCQSCSSQTFCSVCSPGFLLHRDTKGNQICSSTIIEGYGPSTTTAGLHVPCKAFCEDCSSPNIDQCRRCVQGLVIERVPQSGGGYVDSCKSDLEMSSDFGKSATETASLSGQEVRVKCTMSSCSSCRTDYLDCFGCQDSAGKQSFLKIDAVSGKGTKTCTTEIAETEGRSIDPSEKEMNAIRPCKTEGCSDCKDDHMTCKACGVGKWLEGQTCSPCHSSCKKQKIK